MLLRGGHEQPLIPRYFDLLVFLVERRGEAVHRRDIFDRIWSDVVVSDSALSQAIRTIRRVLDDDSREPRYVRTISRHGYRFVFPDVVEEDDDGEYQPVETAAPAPSVPPEPEADPYEPLLQRIAAPAAPGFVKVALTDSKPPEPAPMDAKACPGAVMDRAILLRPIDYGRYETITELAALDRFQITGANGSWRARTGARVAPPGRT